MRAIRLGVVLAALAAILGTASGVSATEPQPVTITVVDTGPADPFTASGGPICSAGDMFNVSVLFIGWESATHAQILETKRFVCPDGAFDLLLRITLDFTTHETVATWSVVDGTGAYASLHGAGTLVGVPFPPNRIIDTYTGGMHID